MKTPIYYTAILYILIFSNNSQSLQTCQSMLTETTPTSDFIDNSDGTTTHKPTGLMWQTCSKGSIWSEGDCTGMNQVTTWQEALQYVDALNVSGGISGFTDWRLPNIKELSSLTEFKCFEPSLNEALFPNTEVDFFDSYYWTSTPAFGDRSWAISFNDGRGTVLPRIDFSYIRLVRNLNN